MKKLANVMYDSFTSEKIEWKIAEKSQSMIELINLLISYFLGGFKIKNTYPKDLRP